MMILFNVEMKSEIFMSHSLSARIHFIGFKKLKIKKSLPVQTVIIILKLGMYNIFTLYLNNLNHFHMKKHFFTIQIYNNI